MMNPLLPRKGAYPVGYPFTYRLVFRAWCLCVVGLWWLQPGCIACPFARHVVELDTASKAYLAPLVFQGKLIQVHVQSPMVKATFRVQKLFKVVDKMASLGLKTDVVVEFSAGRQPVKRGECSAAHIDPTELRSGKRYIVFAIMRKPSDFVAVARPEPHSKRKKSVLAKILCKECGESQILIHSFYYILYVRIGRFQTFRRK